MQFIETIKLINGNIINLKYHNHRFNKTRKHFFNLPFYNLKNLKLKNTTARVRITYNNKIQNIEYFEMKKRIFKTFETIDIDFDYKFKYKKRDNFLNLHSNFLADEFILIKNNLITDTTISNISFFDGQKWITPKTPLLKGTKRAKLIKNKILIPKDIHKNELQNFKKIALINAIMGFYVIEDFIFV